MRYFKSLTIIALLFVAINTRAQNPGYTGKHFIVSAGFKGMPFSGSMLINEDRLDFNLRYSVRLEYIAKHNLSFGFTFEGVNDQVKLNNLTSTRFAPIIIQERSTSSLPVNASFKGNNYGVFAKFYSSESYGAIAPLGNYVITELYINDMIVHDKNRFFDNVPSGNYSFTTATFVLGTGVQYILFNHLTVDISFNLGLNPIGIRGVKKLSEYENSGGNLSFKDPAKKMFSDNILYAKFNIGWLLY